MENIQLIPFLAENVEKIVTEFYATSQLTNEFKPQLDQWLKSAQNSHEAWNFSWLLLEPASKSLECQFYGASCLYNKVSKYFAEVPVDQYDTLKNKLLEKLILYATHSAANKQIRLIQRKLNSALAKLALFLINNQWETCVRDIIETIPNIDLTQAQNNLNSSAPINKNQLISIVIDLLTLLPEESNSTNLNKAKRSQINNELRKNFGLVMQFLMKLFDQFNSYDDLNMIENGIKCLTSWSEFGISFAELQQFIDFAFVAIYQESLFDAAAEFLCSLFSSEENSRYSNTIFKFTPKVLELKVLLNKYVQARDNDGCVLLTKLILAFAENQLHILFNNILFSDEPTKAILYQFLQLLLSLTAMPGSFPVDEESSDLTFVFWYSLQDSLLAMDQNSNELQLIFKPIFLNLMEIFIFKLQMPDGYDDWSDEEKERLRCYRIDIGDTMVYMIGIIGDVMLEFITQRLIQAIELPEEKVELNWPVPTMSYPSSSTSTSISSPHTNSSTAAGMVVKVDRWKIQEALIYMLQSVVSELNESCSPDFSSSNDGYLISFVNLLPRINYINKHILSTTLLAVGSLGNWLENNQNVLPNTVSLCLLGLKTEAVAQSASFALKDIINECDLSPFSDQILVTCQESLKMGHVAQNYEVRLMSIIGICLSDLMPINYMRSTQWLNTIIEPYLIKLNELAQQKENIDKQSQILTCHILNLMSTLMSSLMQRQLSNSNSHGGDGGINDSSFNNSISFTTAASNTTTNNTNLNQNYVDQKKIVNSILIKFLPIYKQIFTRNIPTDINIIDKIFESISVTLSSSLANNNPQAGNETIEPYLIDLIEMFNSLNENAWRRYAFEVCRQLLMIWWKNEKYKQILESLFIHCNRNAMKLMSRDPKWFHDHTDVVEIYSTFLAKLLKSKYYDLFEKLGQDDLIYLIKFMHLGLQLPEQYTLRAVSVFIEEFVKFSKSKNYLMQFVEKNCLCIVEITIISITGASPRHLVDILSGILQMFLKEYSLLTNNFLQEMLIKNDFQPSILVTFNNQQQHASAIAVPQLITREQKLAFIKSIMNEINSKRKFKEIVNEFSLTCRGLANSQYGKETTASNFLRQ